eukprot:252547-Prymnesium_polylepis.1
MPRNCARFAAPRFAAQLRWNAAQTALLFCAPALDSCAPALRNCTRASAQLVQSHPSLAHMPPKIYKPLKDKSD